MMIQVGENRFINDSNITEARYQPNLKTLLVQFVSGDWSEFKGKEAEALRLWLDRASTDAMVELEIERK